LQQKGNHGVSDDPPKTLSSRSQTLSKLQPVEPPQGSKRNDQTRIAQTLREAAGARVPRGGRKTAISAPEAQNRQSRIVLLAPLPGERKPAIRSHRCNALIPREAAVYPDISWGHLGAPAHMQIALFQPDIPQNTGTILRLCACLDVAAHII
jgi:hypothetical protein